MWNFVQIFCLFLLSQKMCFIISSVINLLWLMVWLLTFGSHSECTNVISSYNMHICFLCRKVADAVFQVMDTVVASKVFVECRWLYAIPLYHFLTSTAKPFARTSNSSASHRTSEWWGIAGFEKLVERFKGIQKEDM